MISGWCFVPGKPIVRGYDTSQLFREDAFLRIQHLSNEIAASLREMEELEKGPTAFEKGQMDCSPA